MKYVFRGVPCERLVLFLRHAESEKNLHDYHGHNPSTDYPLTKDGLAAAEDFGLRLANQFRLSTVIASPSMSCIQTAKALARPHGLSVEIRDNLRAVHMGILSQLTDAQVENRHPLLHAELRRFQAGLMHPRHMTIPGREEFNTFWDRISEELHILNKRALPMVVVAHHSSLTMLLNIIASPSGKDEDKSYKRYKFQNLSANIITANSEDASGWSIREVALTTSALLATNFT